MKCRYDDHLSNCAVVLDSIPEQSGSPEMSFAPNGFLTSCVKFFLLQIDELWVDISSITIVTQLLAVWT